MPRVTDVYAALPSITGKFELEYEGELKGADNVARDLIRAAVAQRFDRYFEATRHPNQVVEWFDLGGTLQTATCRRRTSCSADARQCRGSSS